MKLFGKSGIAYLVAILMMGAISLNVAQAAPFASRIHDATSVLEEIPVEEPLTKIEKKALRKEKRAERKAARAALAAEQVANGLARTGWQNIFIPGFGYQMVYFDSFGLSQPRHLGKTHFRKRFY